MIYSDYTLMGGPNSTQMEKFVAVVLHHLPPPADRFALVRNLMELFEEIHDHSDKNLLIILF